MTVEPFYPQDEKLKKCIEYFYFIKTESPDFKKAWYSFPHVNNAVSIYKQVDYDIQKSRAFITENKIARYTAFIQGKKQEPLLVQMLGAINRVTIIFKPLGLNHFVRQPLSEVLGEQPQKFTFWESATGYENFLDNLFAADIPVSDRCRFLEEFLLSQYQLFENDKISRALTLLTDFAADSSVEAVADKLQISTRTFNRLFKLHVGISPVAYKRIARFRHSLNNKLFSEQFKTLTDIGYESNFYDQSYFIKMYKKLAGTKPSAFFKSVDKLADDHLILKFLNA